MAFALTINPFFIHDGSAHSSPTQFLWEIIVAAILGILGYIGCVIFLFQQKNDKNNEQQQQLDLQPHEQSQSQ